MEVHDQNRGNLSSGEGQPVTPLSDRVDAIGTREDLVAFVALLRRDLREQPEDWENPTLERFLAAIAAWTDDMDGYFANRGEPVPLHPSWRMLGELLLAAKYYE